MTRTASKSPARMEKPDFSHLSFAQITDPGLQRARNEDAAICHADLGIFCVCDGMGGMAGGNEASRLVVECIERGLATPSVPASRACAARSSPPASAPSTCR